MIEFELPDPLPEPPPQPVDPETRIADETQVEALKNDFIAHQQQILYTAPEALFRLEGEAAIAGGAAAAAKLAKARDALLERAATSARRTMLAGALDQHLTLAGEDIQRHTDHQKLTWQQRVAQDRLDLLRKQVALDHSDPGLLEGYARAGESAALDQARIEGLLPESDEAKKMAAGARSSLYRSAIEGALAAGNHEAASTLYERAKDKLADADAASLEPELKLASELQVARDYLAKVTPPEQTSATFFDPPRLLAEAEAAHEAVTEQNVTDWSDNPTQLATNQHFIDVQFGKQMRGIEQAKVRLDGAVQNWLAKPAADGQPQTERLPFAIWKQLNPEQQHGVDIVLAQNARGTNIKPVGLERDQPVSDGSAQAIGPSPNDTPAGATRSEIAGTAVRLSEVAVRPYVDFYQRSIVEPFWNGMSLLARSPFGDPGLYASLQGAGPAGSLIAGVGGLTARGLRAVAMLGSGAKEAARIAAFGAGAREAAAITRSGLTAAEQLAVNRAAGVASEDAMEAALRALPIDVGKQVTIKTKSGVSIRMDFVTRDPKTGVMECIECKASPTAPLTPKQTLAFPEIEQSGGTIVGAGKPNLPGGTEIPPQKIQVIRGPRRDAP